MQYSLVTLSALVCFVRSSVAHMIMVEPKQWESGAASSPLDANGGDFPCQNATPNPTPAATYTAGGTGELAVMGSAVHGGGSGQMVITYDFPPTPKSVWRVMQSWEGDHPFKVPANYAPDPSMKHDPISFAIPSELPAGKAVIAWNWFNRIGNREEYMKCATVEIKSDVKAQSSLESLPTMFRANSGNGCIVPEYTDAIAFKNPGHHVVKAAQYTPTPIACDSSLPGTSGGSPTKGDTGPLPPATPSGVPSGSYNSTAPTGSSGPYMPVQTGTTTPVQSYTSPAGSVDEASKPTEPAEPSYPTEPTEPTSECVDGAITCSSDSWSICRSGQEKVVGAIPDGLCCKNGVLSLDGPAKRSVRFNASYRRMRH